ncbi:4-(cytidine 5'-diphospho)-2-C-methyl-D-erythritol kinase [Steroidobacter sp. S1-65]|uniref:4-diphosphocytidyl-2-C-methyl-D-erythritol kinase n=1 Tax=Steroidobacter gossypii TaxID=2805490 RepID=A0ABS1WQ84_9GAMM|nr:4-(cytidine 5'-diphospho)-2-C-methyl-D-erythritol kinase [Steroidobacter gossypii]MBM0103143.1 4-(cytidine 5'-diphospho)-2-C-methyl-D-erythritol kinase [Steroidobacter gossypii]
MNDELLGLPEPWPAPAKLNLCLHIVGRRDDGYHLLQSAMQLIDLCDELRFYKRPAGVIERVGDNSDIPAEADLIVRAARLLATRYEVFDGVGIEIHKRIPVQGGLGGGSSDAATVLVALNHLWRLDLKIEQLATVGLELGADVPFFVRGHSAWTEGVGERLTPVDFPEQVYLVIKPQSGVSTAAVFQDPELTRNSPLMTIRDLLAGGGRNDCAPVVRKRHAEIAEALDWLGEFGEARLTGTGACVFVGMPDDATARSAAARVPARWTGYVVRGLNRSPLLDRLAHEAA